MNESTDLLQNQQDPNWAEKKAAMANEAFAEAQELLYSTIFCTGHEDPSLDIDPSELHELDMAEVIRRSSAWGIDNFIQTNCYTSNRMLFKGWLHDKKDTYHWLVKFGPGSMGPPGGAHGGAIAAVMDQLAGYSGFQRGWVMTGEFKMHYKSMTPVNEVHYCTSHIAKEEGRKLLIKTYLRPLPILIPPDDQANPNEGPKDESIRLFNKDTKNLIRKGYVVPNPRNIGDFLMIRLARTPIATDVNSNDFASHALLSKKWMMGYPMNEVEADLAERKAKL